ncbi:glycosyltransferase [Nioella nitratireducens]|uniref:glycosyltransferase n=1 Tax=Nioella nitratireducens TaxID=1287720 RepID=UPI0013141125|nr:glycosyltransferase [Nioella nitratireducens]
MTDPGSSRIDFDPGWYLATYPDVKAAGVDPWEHYLAHGRDEGRLGAPVRAMELDHILWRGFEEMALPELRLLLRNGSPRERALAGWFVARHASSQGRWKTALSAIRIFLDSDEGLQIVSHRGPWVLAIKAAAVCGETTLARKVLARARDRFGAHADFALGDMEIALAEDTSDGVLSEHLQRVYDGTDLVPVGLSGGSGPRFDRLTAKSDPAPVKNGPLVSVIIPAFRAEGTLPTCLRGLTAQSWRNLEIIVVDDASPDGTADVADRAAKFDPRIRVIRQSENEGAYVARNSGLAVANGAFFTVHDADDWSHPQKIEEQLRPLLKDKSRIASTSHWVRVGPDLSMTLWRIEDGWVYRNVSSLMVRAEMREAIGYWDRVRINADTEYYHRIIAAFGKEAIAEQQAGVPLAFGRNAPQSLTLSSETHLSTQFRGPRRAYLDSALYWQAGQISALKDDADIGARTAALYLPQIPDRRPFPAPAATRPSDANTVPSDYATIATSPHFDPLWYLAHNPDVLSADADPVRHYLQDGGREDRDPGPLFSDSGWRRLRGLLETDVPLLDYERSSDCEKARPLRFEGKVVPNDRPNVLVFAHSADRRVFGAERSLLRTLEHLAEGTDGPKMAPVVVLPSAVNKDYLDEIRARAIAVEILPQLWRHRFRQVAPETVAVIRKMIQLYQPLELHVNTLVLNAPLIAARIEGCPSVVHVRELPAEDPALCQILGDSSHGLRRSILAETDRFVANSSAVANWLNCPERVTIRLNEVDPALFDLPHTPGKGLRVALISSNLAKKGIADFVKVAQLVGKAEVEDGLPPSARCRFLLIGPDSADLQTLFPLPSNTTHTGYAEGPVAAIKQADVVLILSHFAESFGRTALEAMAAGRPVICYNRGTPPTLIAQGQTGFAVPPYDQEAVARAVLALSVARLKLADMSRAARRRAADCKHSTVSAVLSASA